MKIYSHRYEHEPLPGKRIWAALLRVVFGPWNEGFADLHPWTEFGEAPIERQLEGIVAGRPSRLAAKSLYFAEVDARARRGSRNLLAGLDLPLSHALVNLSSANSIEEKIAGGFHCLKAKAGANLANETKMLLRYPQVRWRLDFSAKLTESDFMAWWMQIEPALKSKIDAIEDPARELSTINRAMPVYADWVEGHWIGKVFKPARDFSFLMQKERRFQRVMFTHSLDHPVAQAAAVWEAAKFYRRYPRLRQVCGFSPLPEFQNLWKRTGPRVCPPQGYGFGFDDCLHSVRWERVL